MRKRRLEGKRAVVTGASSGVGGQSSEPSVGRARRWLSSPETSTDWRRLPAEVRERGSEAMVLPLDVADGWSATKAIIGQCLIPGFLNRYLAKHAWTAQETHKLPPGHPLKQTETTWTSRFRVIAAPTARSIPGPAP